MVLFQVLLSEIVRVMSPAGLNRNSGAPEHDGHRVSLNTAFIFISNGGVLEYFSAKQIAKLLKIIAGDLKPSAFAFIEPLAMKYNLETEIDSRPYGTEWSFSHNYKQLLESYGFNICYQHEMVTDGNRWLLMLVNTKERIV